MDPTHPKKWQNGKHKNIKEKKKLKWIRSHFFQGSPRGPCVTNISGWVQCSYKILSGHMYCSTPTTITIHTALATLVRVTIQASLVENLCTCSVSKLLFFEDAWAPSIFEWRWACSALLKLQPSLMLPICFTHPLLSLSTYHVSHFPGVMTVLITSPAQ